MIYYLKEKLKRFSGVYWFLIRFLGPTLITAPSLRLLTNRVSRHETIVNVGSGNYRLDKGLDRRILNVDYSPYPNVNIIADAHVLPMKNGSVGGVISNVLLEHVPDPTRCVAEMFRILKTDGLLYCRMPFVVPYHSAPGDYHRWTKEGVEHLFKDFKIEQLGVAVGPTSAFLWVFQEWIAILFSFNMKWLYEIILLVVMVITAPLKLLDFILARYQFSSNLASGFYVLARKPGIDN